jgi:deazaflavin-dependent oxidoreductase (nitroreductase family)
MTMRTRSGAPTGRGWRPARATAPIARALAGRRCFPLWAVVRHRGRKTGRALSVPVAVIPARGSVLVALPWGPRTNWTLNVLAGGGCELRWKGAEHRVAGPRLLDREQARPYFGPVTWAVVRFVVRADSFLLLPRQG